MLKYIVNGYKIWVCAGVLEVKGDFRAWYNAKNRCLTDKAPVHIHNATLSQLTRQAMVWKLSGESELLTVDRRGRPQDGLFLGYTVPEVDDVAS